MASALTWVSHVPGGSSNDTAMVLRCGMASSAVGSDPTPVAPDASADSVPAMTAEASVAHATAAVHQSHGGGHDDYAITAARPTSSSSRTYRHLILGQD